MKQIKKNENKINDIKKKNQKKKQKINSQNIQSTENSESARQQIIEEIDTIIPKNNTNGENAKKEGDKIIQRFSPNIICDRLITKCSDRYKSKCSF